MIGYWLAPVQRNAGVRKPVLAAVTQTVVDAADPAFSAPTKFIGPIYDRAQADRLAAQNGWTMAEGGPHWRRVVPSPEPLWLVEQESIEQLVSGGTGSYFVGRVTETYLAALYGKRCCRTAWPSALDNVARQRRRVV
ncbi:carbamate kinase [Lentzea waywayandensis]|uniref:Carbamate kinase n=1 Tax=Lentzea waywayandensis TaxID=84724 RepID=A0A1I6D3H3_9PSEU|nr:hypothetical protein [Lentzea waywayandensis]SFR00019.1 carbamate kinase [Lentzea waywayandensis]